MDSFDSALQAFTDGQIPYVNGDPSCALAVWSTSADITLCNPVGPPVRGPQEVERAAAAPSAGFSHGEPSSPEEIARYVTDDLGYVVRIERGSAHIDGSPDALPYALRVTMVFRREGDEWKLAHRHAETITTARPLESIVASA